MSHEIRTPISGTITPLINKKNIINQFTINTGILGMGRLMEETGLTPDQSEYISTIRNCGENLLAVVNDIMDYTKLEAAGTNLIFSIFNLWFVNFYIDLALEKVEMSLATCMEDALYLLC